VEKKIYDEEGVDPSPERLVELEWMSEE